MLDYEFHLIVTMRTRTTYEVERDEKGKTRIQKMGTKPKQREGLEYEFTTVLDLQLPYHLAETSKDRTGFLDQRPPFALDEELGEKLVAWPGRCAGAEVPATAATQRRPEEPGRQRRARRAAAALRPVPGRRRPRRDLATNMLRRGDLPRDAR